MTGCQALIGPHANLAATATLTASSVAPVANAVKQLPTVRDGSAAATITGSYTGADEAVYDIQIVDTNITTPLTSEPVFQGVGNGTLTGATFNVGTAQTFTVELADLGTALTAAATDFEGVTLRARTAGADGNDITISINRAPGTSPLTFTASSFSLINDLPAGAGSDDNPLSGAEYDWNTAVMGTDGLIPAAAVRVAFGLDRNNVYRQYKRYQNGQWRYYFEPEIALPVPRGTVVYTVTGGRTVTITDGVTPEVYTGIVTLYDLLSKIKTTSQLVEVVGVVAADRARGGQAARELLTRTDAHALVSSGSGSEHATGFEGITVGSGAATELIEARCYAVSGKDAQGAAVGAELWQLKGSVSGMLDARLVSGVPYVGTNVSLTIPRKVPDGFGSARGAFTVTAIKYQQRAENEISPPICPVALSLGPNANDQGLALIYTKRPSGDCACDTMRVPILNASCFGGESSEDVAMSWSGANLARLKKLRKMVRDYIDRGTAADLVQAIEGGNIVELPTLADEFEAVLTNLNALAAGTPRNDGEAAWDVAFAGLARDRILPFYRYDTGGGAYVIRVVIQASEALAAGDAVGYYLDESGNNRCKKHNVDTAFVGFATAGVSSGADATIQWNGTNTDVTFAPTLAAPQFVSPDADGSGGWSLDPYGFWFVPADDPGGGDKPIEFSDERATTSATRTTASARAALAWVYTCAGISPVGKSRASTLSSVDGCWRDYGDDYYWRVIGERGEYEPAFNNRPYYSSMLFPASGEDPGGIRRTNEFAFQINVKCPESLKEDDEIDMAIGDSAWPSTYQVGDTLYLPVIAAQNLALTGGQDGDNVQTWYVSGSVDGPFTPHSLDLDSPAAYSSGGLQFLITPGKIANAKGDRFTFDVAGGHWRWRKNTGSWSSSAAIDITPVVLDSGLSVTFAPGAAPAFAAGDVYSYRALQPNSPSNVKLPTWQAWRWPGSSATLVLDLGSAKAFDFAGLAFHGLPSSAGIALDVSDNGSSWTSLGTIAWNAVVCGKFIAQQNKRYVRFSLTSAADGAVGWVVVGQSLTTEYSAEWVPKRSYRMDRASAGLTAAAAYLGRGTSGTLTWPDATLSETDRTALETLIDGCKSAGDAPLILYPNLTRASEPVLATIADDDVELPDVGNYQPDSGHERRYRARIGFTGVAV